ncbi:MAG: hypothetical protein V1853_03010 [bacterium]
MVAIIVVMSLAIPTMLTMWANVAWKSSSSEALADAFFYAQELMEVIKSKRFDEKTIAPYYTNSNNFGVDPDENSNNNATFDDVDDFVNATDSWVTTPATKYIRFANVSYVFLNSTNSWQPCPLPVICTAVTDCSSCDQCCYKRVAVGVSHQGNLVNNLTLTTIVSGN